MIINQSIGGLNVTDALLVQYPVSGESRTILPGHFIKFVEDNGTIYVEKALGEDENLGTHYIQLEERHILQNSTITSVRIMKIDDTRIFVVYNYKDATNYYITEARIIALENGAFSYGTPLKVVTATSPNSVFVGSIQMCLISDNRILFTYTSAAVTNQIVGRVIDIEGLDLTLPGNIHTLSTTTNTVVVKTWYAGNNIAWIAYGTTSATSTLRLRPIEINGTVLTGESEIPTSVTNFTSGVNDFCEFGPNKYLLVFYTGSNVRSCFITTSGTSASLSTVTTIYNSSMKGSLSLCKMTDTTCIVVFSDPQGIAIPITVDSSTNTITPSTTTYAFYSYGSYHVSITPVTATKAIITYMDTTIGNQKYYARVANYNESDNSLTFGENLTIANANVGFNDGTQLINDTSVFFFNGIINSASGLAVTILTPSDADSNVLLEGMEVTFYGDGVIDGIARSGGEPGDTIYIYTLTGTVESAIEAMSANAFVQTI